MLPRDAARATGAAVALVRSFGLPVGDVEVLQSSNRLTLRLRPAETVARVAPAEAGAGELEVALARLLVTTLGTLGRRVAAAGPGQPLHGEPHPGNVLDTAEGPLFIDLETCCRGPVEVDVAQLQGGADPHYRGVDAVLLEDCRVLSLALATAWRWDRHDQLPDGARLGALWLDQLREAVER